MCFAEVVLAGGLVAGQPRHLRTFEVDEGFEASGFGFPDKSQGPLQRRFDRGSCVKTVRSTADPRDRDLGFDFRRPPNRPLSREHDRLTRLVQEASRELLNAAWRTGMSDAEAETLFLGAGNSLSARAIFDRWRF
jgi:hypothetical protein